MNEILFIKSLNNIEKRNLLKLLLLDTGIRGNKGLTPVKIWYDNNSASVRLCNVLRDSGYKFIELITHDQILKCRNAGKATLKEFIELRGY